LVSEQEQMYHHPSQQQVPPPLEWRPDVERLKVEIEAARRTGNSDHLAIAEAECWIELIDAELASRRNANDLEADRLKRWRSEIEHLLSGGQGPARTHMQVRRA
jgi:hypothetical protein